MMDFLFQAAVNLIEFWILLLLAQFVCASHIRLTLRNVLVCSAFSVLGVLLAFLLDNESLILVNMVLALVLTVLLFSRTRPGDLLRLLPAFSIYFALTVAPEILLDELLPATHINLVFHDQTFTLVSILTDVSLLLLLLFLGRLLTKNQITLHFRAREILGSIALLFFAIIDVGFVMILNRSQIQPGWRFLYMTLFLGGFVFSLAYYIYSLAEARRRIRRQTLARSETEYLKMQLEALQDVKENEEQARRLRHDLSSHLALIETLCEDGKLEEVRQYAEQLSHLRPLSNSRILTGNQVADLVINSRAKICEEQNILFSFEGSLSRLGALKAPDICGLFSNAYDNAIEACRNHSGAYIRTTVNSTRNYTVIRIVNSVEKKVPIRNNGAATTKADKGSHGYGIEIMKDIARKYGGSCTLRCDSNEFEVKIVLLT